MTISFFSVGNPQSLLLEGLDAAKGAAGTDGRLFWAYDSRCLYRDSGTVWVRILRESSPNFQSYMAQMFGDGLDGPLHVIADTTLPDSGIGVKVMRYTDLEIDAGKYLTSYANDKALVILAKNIYLNGTIKMDGRGGVAGGILLGGGAGAVGGGGAGSTGSANGAGGGGCGQDGAPAATKKGGGHGITADMTGLDWSKGGPAPGIGGDGATLGSGGNPGSLGTSYLVNPLSPLPFEIIRRLFGGGGGGGGAVGARGGGVLWIEANNLVCGGSALVSANGNTAPDDGGTSAGGGGGGGAAQAVYSTKTGVLTMQANGGNGGNGAGLGDGGNGAPGITGEFQVF